MKRLLAGFAFIVVAAFITLAILLTRDAPVVGSDGATETPQPTLGEAAAPAGAPEINLRLNGLAPGTKPFVLMQGDPVLVEFQLRHPDRQATQPIRLEPPTGSWAERAKIQVTDGQGTASNWRFVVTGKPSPGGLILKPAAVTTLVLRMNEDARQAIVPGSYKMIARLELADGRGFRGTINSELAHFEVVSPPAALVGAALGRRQLLRVRDALLSGDLARAETAATEMQRAEPHRPEGFIGMALVHEATGDRSGALFSVELAISRAMGGSRVEDELTREDSKATGRPRVEPKQALRLVPVEYYELLRRIESLPPSNPPKK